MLTDPERHLLRVCIDRYVDDLRRACQEDQGTPDGQPGTVGNDLQRRLADLRQKAEVL